MTYIFLGVHLSTRIGGLPLFLWKSYHATWAARSGRTGFALRNSKASFTWALLWMRSRQQHGSPSPTLQGALPKSPRPRPPWSLGRGWFRAPTPCGQDLGVSSKFSSAVTEVLWQGERKHSSRTIPLWHDWVTQHRWHAAMYIMHPLIVLKMAQLPGLCWRKGVKVFLC